MNQLIHITHSRLMEAIQAVCPIVSIGLLSMDPNGVTIDYDPTATLAQKTAATNIVQGFNWTKAADDAWQKSKNLSQAKNEVSDAADPMLLMSRNSSRILLALINENRTALNNLQTDVTNLRAQLVALGRNPPALASAKVTLRTWASVLTAIRNQIDAETDPTQ